MPDNNNNEDKLLYEQLSLYENVADNLKYETAENDNISLEKKQEILYPLIDDVKEMAESMIDDYIVYLKDKTNKKIVNKIQESIKMILRKIDEFENKIYDLYLENGAPKET
ncbi:MAG: hypothetical protein LBH46_03830 [Rickettsiales bacterium]|nr:hypothetical protein [Rickettsiales bacterium]